VSQSPQSLQSSRAGRRLVALSPLDLRCLAGVIAVIEIFGFARVFDSIRKYLLESFHQGNQES
jgi:hypothetical protein